MGEVSPSLEGEVETGLECQKIITDSQSDHPLTGHYLDARHRLGAKQLAWG